jgi:hypothetical protein
MTTVVYPSLAAALAVDAHADAELRDAIEQVLTDRENQVAGGGAAALDTVYRRLTGWQSTPVDNPVGAESTG